MNIGIVTTWFERGAAYVSRQFMDVLSKDNNVFIYVRGGESYAKGDPKWDLPNIHWGRRNLGKNNYIDGTYINKTDFVRWIKKNNIDAILFNEQRWFQPLLWCKELKVKTIAYVDYYTERTIPIFDIFDCLVCNTQRHAFAFREHKNVNYMKWGTDLNLFKPTEEKHDKLTFFHSAGMDPVRKGTDVVITSFYNSTERQKAHLLIHTQVSLEKNIPKQSEMIKELLNEGTLEIVQKTISAPGLFYRGDVYVYPSRLDGIGLTLMEGIASGLACITIDNAPMNEFVEEDFGKVCSVDYYYSRYDGYYWPMAVPSTESLTSIFNDFLDGKYDIEKMKKAARDYAIKELDFNKNCQALHKIIQETKFVPADKNLVTYINKFDRQGMKGYGHYIYPLYYIKEFVRSIVRKK